MTDQIKKDLIKKACGVFSKYDGNGSRNNSEYMAALKPIREEAEKCGMTLDDLYREYLKRKEIINEANNIFTIMNSDGPKNNNELMIRLGKIREKAKKMDIDLSSLWRKQKGLDDMFDDDEIDIHNIKIEDPITEEYCEAFLKSILKNIENGSAENAIYSRKVTLEDSKMRGPNEPKYNNNQMSFLILIEGLKILISRIKSGDTKGLNDGVVSQVLSIGIENFEEFFNKGKTENEALNEFINIRIVYGGGYCVSMDHAGRYAPVYFFKQKDNDINPMVGETSNAYRIYLNNPRTKQSEEFIMDYCIECQRQGISFDMKMFENSYSEGRCDSTILYSTYADINKKVAILKKLLDKYPNIQFGSPPPSCAKIEGIEELGICHIGLSNKIDPKTISSNYPIDRDAYWLSNLQTYNDYIDSIFSIALRRLIEDLGYSNYFSDSIKGCTSEVFIKGISTSLILGKDKDKLKEFISMILSDKTMKEKAIKKLCDYMHQEHNKINGYPIDAKKNIALDTWYIDELRERHSKDDSMNVGESKK